MKLSPSPSCRSFPWLGCLLCLTLLAALALPQQLWAQATQPAVVEELIILNLGGSRLVRTPWRVKRVAVAQPNTADVTAVAPDQVLVVAKATGRTDLLIWDQDDQPHHRQVQVVVDAQRLGEDLVRLLPGSSISVTQAQDVVTVHGLIPRAQDIKTMHTFLQTAGVRFVDATSLGGVQQVLIKVRVAEASRTALRSLSINALHTGDSFFGGSTIGGNANNINIGVPTGTPATSNLPFGFNSATSISQAVTLFTGFPDIDLQLFFQALEQNEYLRTLAEPTLIALSGEEANFLAGGEFPIPIVQGSGGGAVAGGSAISVQFKEFGVRLRFRPTVLGDGAIRLHVAPEVSDLSDVGSVQIQGFSIPSLVSRRAETTLEMKTGQTFAMAGLIDRQTRARAGKVPGIGSVPILGALFRSVRYEMGDTELVVLVTVSLVEPLNQVGARPLPGDLHRPPNDWDLYLNGKIEGKERVLSPADTQWMRSLGLQRLRGPGAWATHQDPGPTLRAATTWSQRRGQNVESAAARPAGNTTAVAATPAPSAAAAASNPPASVTAAAAPPPAPAPAVSSAAAAKPAATPPAEKPVAAKASTDSAAKKTDKPAAKTEKPAVTVAVDQPSAPAQSGTRARAGDGPATPSGSGYPVIPTKR